MVIVADLNPRTTLGTTGVFGQVPFELAAPGANSANHGGDYGQHVSLMDGHVEKIDAPDDINDDDIYASSIGDDLEENKGLRSARADAFLIP